MNFPQLPRLENPPVYQGLYLFDFGDRVSVGYTAAEIAVLLDSEAYRHGKPYKIQRVHPDGTMDIRGVHPDRWQLEMGMFFCSRQAELAKRDMAELSELASAYPVPSRAKLQRGRLPGVPFEHAVALIYPAEYDDEWAEWLLARDYRGGEIAEGGISHVGNWYTHAAVAERRQLWAQPARADRTPEEVLAAVDRPIQRQAV